MKVLACLLEQHDFRLVAPAILICGIGCVAALRLLARGGAAPGARRLSWLLAAAFAFGFGAWAFDAIAMLAFRPAVPIDHDFLVTLLSLVIGVLGCLPGFALYLARPGDRGAAVLGGAVVGGAVAAMHFIGMQAMQVAGSTAYDPAYVVVATLLGIGFGVAALRLAPPAQSPKHNLAAAGLLLLSVFAVHFIATAGVHFMPAPDQAAPGTIAAAQPLALAVVAVSLLILLLCLAGSIFKEHAGVRTAAESQRLRQLADATFEGILIHRDGVILDANAALGELAGIAPATLIGRNVAELAAPASSELLRHRLEAPSQEVTEIDITLADGTRRPVEILSRPIERDGEQVAVLAMRDISDRKRAEDRIRHLAHHDSLTGLPNRSLFNDRMQQALTLSGRQEQGLAVLCLDLDGFKLVNDLHGYRFGDRLLVHVADRLRNAVRSLDTVARLGGDEFAVVQPFARQPNAAANLAERLLASLSAPFDIDGRQVLVGTSIGLALYPDNGSTVTDLLKNADTALYRAKRDGRGTFRFFEAAMDLHLQARRLLEQDLRQAINKHQLELYYQPLFTCADQNLSGFEALLRWTHPVHGKVSPVDFIPLAEECGLIVPLGRWVLEAACAEAASWTEPAPVAVNLSPAQFRQADLPKVIAEILGRTGLAPERLELEVTEGLLIDDTDRALSTLTALKALGIRIALDDFGTGFSSLSYLRRFPFDKIKIDRSFVQSLGRDDEAMAIIRAILAMANSLRLDVTAEGVETELHPRPGFSARPADARGRAVRLLRRSRKTHLALPGAASRDRAAAKTVGRELIAVQAASA